PLSLHDALPTLMLIPLAAFSASDVKSFSSKQLVTNAAGEAVYESAVSCVRFREPVKIARAQSGGDWCGVEVPGYCARTQIAAAREVCSVGCCQAMKSKAGSPQGATVADQAPAAVEPAQVEPVAEAAASVDAPVPGG